MADASSLEHVAKFFTIRYLYGSALTCILWDILVTFDDEVRYIWSQKINMTTVVFVLNRYGIAAVQAFFQYGSSGMGVGLDRTRCQILIPLVFIFGIISSAFTNGYMAYYYIELWERNRRVLVAFIVLFVVTYVPATVLLLKATAAAHDIIYLNTTVNECYATQEPTLTKGFWGLLVLFDLCALIGVVLNTLDRPHRSNLDAFKALRNDGAPWFLALFMLRLVNLVLTLLLPPEDVFMHVFAIWGSICIPVSRFIFRVERLRRPKTRVYLWDAHAEAFQLEPWRSREPETPAPN